MAIRVLNLQSQTTTADLEELFSPYGSIENIELSPGSPTAIVSLKQGESEAIQALDGTEWRGSIISLEKDRGKGPKH